MDGAGHEEGGAAEASELEEDVVTIMISELKVQTVEEVVKATDRWVMFRNSNREGKVELRTPALLQELRASGSVFQELDFSTTLDFVRNEADQPVREVSKPDGQFSAMRSTSADTISRGDGEAEKSSVRHRRT